jgi:hypothetical protein
LELIQPYGGRLVDLVAHGEEQVFVDTPLQVCEERDVKGFYARARAGELKGFTGVDDPYEPPVAPEILLSTQNTSPEENARRIVNYLVDQGFVPRTQSHSPMSFDLEALDHADGAQPLIET